ncbi:MAG: phosphatidate cytidylyltransferase [Sphingomicrobium sp.]
MSELAKRSLVGIFLIIGTLLLAVVGGWPFAILVAAVATVMYVEWTRLVSGWGVSWKLFGFFYCLAPALSLLWIRERAEFEAIGQGFDLLVWVFIIVWATDIGAFFAGRAIGGPKLAPSISPSKTVAGLVGGVLSAAVLASVWVMATELPSLLNWLAAPFAVIAQVGDLFESGLKRRAGLKDSGTWLPGHGGLLDRVDGLVPVAVLTAALMASDWL